MKQDEKRWGELGPSARKALVKEDVANKQAKALVELRKFSKLRLKKGSKPKQQVDVFAQFEKIKIFKQEEDDDNAFLQSLQRGGKVHVFQQTPKRSNTSTNSFDESPLVSINEILSPAPTSW